MGSKTFDGVRFSAFSHDHPPPHVHGHCAELVAIVSFEDSVVRLMERPDNVTPGNAKRSDVAHIVRTAAKYAEELLELWRSARD